jgi:glycosyltransferase involved in cell wall biosynthesis
MREQGKLRAMWLLNHTAARKFEIPMLKSIGIEEIFLPKIIPPDHDFRSASIDFSEDDGLSIPAKELAVLNATDWYREPGIDAWSIANRYFNVAFFILHRLELLSSISKHFAGAAIWRVYGLDKSISYSRILDLTRNGNGWHDIRRMGDRFWFGEAYRHLHEIERPALQKRAIYFPAGLDETLQQGTWSGQRNILFFVCPEIGSNPYYKKQYDEFRGNFSTFDYLIGGSQPIAVEDPNVLGWSSSEQHQRNMRELRVMFYQSTEPNHIHYHPFEAIQAGMPLVFMAGGLLDSIGGGTLPGRCLSLHEARDKIRRILGGDHLLIDAIRDTQGRLLESVRPAVCRPEWLDSFRTIRETAPRESRRLTPQGRKKRLAVIVPVRYRGGTLRAAKLLAVALAEGSRQRSEEIEVVFGHVDDASVYGVDDFEDLPPAVTRRPFDWCLLDAAGALRAMTYAGFRTWRPSSDQYAVPDDGIRQFVDCDLWVIVSDRLPHPLLPVRPYVLLVHDYVQRYLPDGRDPQDSAFLAAARYAERVLVTTKFTEQDALQYAGLDPARVFRVPMLAPRFEAVEGGSTPADTRPYFLWTTNAAAHKNHVNAFKALRIYWQELEGTLDCHVSGANTSGLLDVGRRHLELLGSSPEDRATLRARIRVLGELPDISYRRELIRAGFLWHPARNDNGTLSAIEAAHLRVPCLSSDYPAMREIDGQFELGLAWMPGDDPIGMARALRWMEDHYEQQRGVLPTTDRLRQQDAAALASRYWTVVRECL